MYKVKIYGGGSIGNHLAHAARSKGCEVTLCDVDPKALERTKNQIYPQRYGHWDDSIRLCVVTDVPGGDFDIIMIGTPPDNHLALAIKCLTEERPKVLLIEKPLCPPNLEKVERFHELVKQSETRVFVGYNHTLGRNTLKSEEILSSQPFGKCVTLHAGFQEHWGGIFKAHPWLAGPHQSYLGFSNKGGGACGEHSHAINIWQHFAHLLNLGRIVEVSATMDMVENHELSYDQICNISVKTEKGFYGTIVQDVVTSPARKWLRVQCEEGFLEWYVNFDDDSDAVISQVYGNPVQRKLLPKRRPEDFQLEVEHLLQVLESDMDASPIAVERSLDTMMVIAAAHLSHRKKRAMYIDYSQGYKLEAIQALRESQ